MPEQLEEEKKRICISMTIAKQIQDEHGNIFSKTHIFKRSNMETENEIRISYFYHTSTFSYFPNIMTKLYSYAQLIYQGIIKM